MGKGAYLDSEKEKKRVQGKRLPVDKGEEPGRRVFADRGKAQSSLEEGCSRHVVGKRTAYFTERIIAPCFGKKKGKCNGVKIKGKRVSRYWVMTAAVPIQAGEGKYRSVRTKERRELVSRGAKAGYSEPGEGGTLSQILTGN